MILEAIDTAASWILGSGASATAVAIILVIVLYGRRALKLGGVAASWFQTILVTLAIIAVLLATGVFELDLVALQGVLAAIVDLLFGLIRGVVG